MVIVWFRLLTSCIICYFTCLQDIIKLPWHKMGSGKTFFSELYISMPKKSLRAKRDSPAPGDSPGEKQQGRGWSRGCAPMLSWSLQQYCLRCTLLWPLSSSAEGLALMFYGLSITPVLLTVKQMWKLIKCFFLNTILEVLLPDQISSIAPQGSLV